MGTAITSGIGFALLSLVFAGFNDVVFKRYAKKDRSRGLYVAAIGGVWFFLQFAQVQFAEHTLVWNHQTIAFGLLAGIFLTLANLLLLESLGRIDLGLGSTIYRLNTIGVVVLSFLLLGESLGMAKAAGVAAGIAAVLFLYENRNGSRAARGFLLFFGVAIIASFFRAAYGISTKAGLLEAADPQAMLLIASLCWVAGGALYAVGREKRLKVTRKKMIYAAISGVLVYLISNTLMMAVQRGDASIVIPIANMSFMVALLLSVAFRMETLTRRKGCALGLAIMAIMLLTQA